MTEFGDVGNKTAAEVLAGVAAGGSGGGHNYGEWSKSIRLSLMSRRKFGFITDRVYQTIKKNHEKLNAKTNMDTLRDDVMAMHSLVCSFCNRTGHVEATCYTKHGFLRQKKKGGELDGLAAPVSHQIFLLVDVGAGAMSLILRSCYQAEQAHFGCANNGQ
ncbi:hypothetical protein Leryth_021388 [Lithospermum erythrorhizon]|nr:hypothetical protein Leryth_021388 [Lithospermum erythrorhizon]